VPSTRKPSIIEELPLILKNGKLKAEQAKDLAKAEKLETNIIEYIIPNHKTMPEVDIRTLETWTNRLIQCDNLLCMAKLLQGDRAAEMPSLKGKVDLIYIDPPFYSKSNYQRRIKLHHTSMGKISPITIKQEAYTDSQWQDGIKGYLDMIYPRLYLMKELLSDRGSIYVHLDSNIGHYVKVLLDEIFGEDNFQREIVWRIGWISGFKSNAKNWIRNHDTIYYYVNDRKNFIFNKQYLPYPEDYVRRDGKKPTGKGYPIEDTWNSSPIDKLDSIQIKSFSREKVGYDTQKNEALLQRIIESSSYEGSMVADFFAGSGTTGVVAEKLNRKWLMSDLGWNACITTQKRLIEEKASPFIYQRISKPTSKSQEKSISFTISEISNSVDGMGCEIHIQPIEGLLQKMIKKLPPNNHKIKDFLKLVEKEPWVLVDYIGLDTDYDGVTLTSCYHWYRKYDGKDDKQSRIHIETGKAKFKRICLRLVDIFGNEVFTEMI
jgi:DNA modification methylase